MIEPTTGQIQFLYDGILINPLLSLEQFLISPVPAQCREVTRSETWCFCRLPAVNFGGHTFLVDLAFNGSILQGVSIFCSDLEFGSSSSWADWSEDGEVARKLFHDSLLECALGEDWLRQRFVWGSLYSEFCRRSGCSTIQVVYVNRMNVSPEPMGVESGKPVVRQLGHSMDASEKKRLKKLGKQQIALRSRELQERLSEVSGAPFGTDEWYKRDRQSGLKEKELRLSQPDIVYASECERDFVLEPVSASDEPVRTIYIECKGCHDVLHSVPSRFVTCSCKALKVSIFGGRLIVSPTDSQAIQWVRLIARGSAELGFIDRQNQRKSVAKRLRHFCFRAFVRLLHAIGAVRPQIPGKFVLTSGATMPTRLAQSVDAQFAAAVRSTCEGWPWCIAACYLLETLESETGLIKSLIVVTLDNEASMNLVTLQFQKMLRQFPAQARNTYIVSSAAFATSYYSGSEFFVRQVT